MSTLKEELGQDDLLSDENIFVAENAILQNDASNLIAIHEYLEKLAFGSNQDNDISKLAAIVNAMLKRMTKQNN